MLKKITIAIDGFSSCGKSTLARQLAKALNYAFIDTGAMYRAITLYFIRHQTNLLSLSDINKALENIHLQFQFNPATEQSEIFLNNENVEPFIREMQVAEKVSTVAAIKAVRQFAVHQQQLMGKQKGIVMDGRDIGTVVFPDAELKIFMTADTNTRVQRRFKELQEKNSNTTLDEVRENLQSRDYLDTHREESPLKQAKNAVVLDNTHLSPEEQFNLALSWANEKIASSQL
jgi:cytidylate kinase